MNYKDIRNIDEKDYLDSVIKHEVPVVTHVLGNINNVDGQTHISYTDPTIVISPRNRVFKRRFIAYSNLDSDEVNIPKTPITFKSLNNTTIPNILEGVENKEIKMTERTDNPLLTFEYSENNIKLDLTFNFNYETDYNSGEVSILDIEQYPYEAEVYKFFLITVEINFENTKLINKILDFKKFTKTEGLMAISSAIHQFDNELIPLICEDLDLYELINDPIQELEDALLIEYSLHMGDIFGFWYLLKLGINLNVDIVSKNRKDKVKAAYVIIENALTEQMILSLYSKPDFYTNIPEEEDPLFIAIVNRLGEESTELNLAVVGRILYENNDEKYFEEQKRVMDEIKEHSIKLSH